MAVLRMKVMVAGIAQNGKKKTAYVIAETKDPCGLSSRIAKAGNSAVGKTALVQAFHGDATLFAKNYNMTVGVDLVVKSVNIPDSGAVVEMYLCDCSGKEIFQSSLETHHHAAGVCLVFDLTDEGSLASCSSWMQCLGSFHIAGVLVGTKGDLTSRRVVSAERAQSVAASLGLNYFETSAKEMLNCDAPFSFLADAFHRQYEERVEQARMLI